MNKIKIICECGVNFHNLEEAKLMIRKSKEVGAVLCKFQLYNDEVIKDLEHYEFLKSIQLDYAKAKELFDYGKSIGQEVFFTPMFDCIDFLEEIGVRYYKIRYKDQENEDILKKIHKTEKLIFISTQRFDIPSIYWELMNMFPLYCVPHYPASIKEYGRGNIYLGVSDHTSNLELLKYQKVNGCMFFEKHVKLNDNCIESAWSVSFEQLKEVLRNDE